ncbi:MAG: DUF1573 domain-containing protein [Deltaproteobacteria bacterium]|jgi:hypothetical protein|nr:DUF1573 domain-containing protein [Deltaproteobacteria bacterium]
MKTKMLLLAALLLAVWLAIPGNLSAQSDPLPAPIEEAGEKALAPLMTIDEPSYFAGEARPGTTITHDYIIKNTGTAPLLIEDVVPGCGCSVATFTKQIEPGGEGKITLTVDLYPEWAGHYVNKAAIIRSNDPINPTSNITIRAKVLSN